IHGARLLAETAIDAFNHVDVVTRGSTGAVIAARTGLDGDRLRRANRFAEFTGNAPLLAVRVATQRVLATEARRDRILLVRVIDRGLSPKKVAHAQHEAGHELQQKQALGCAIESHRVLISPRLSPARRIE